MLTDYHIHILPELDDGSKNIKMSIEMFRMLKDQGVERIVATPHFYAHREKSVDQFIEKRQRALDKISSYSQIPILLGAEVAIENKISEIKDIEKLAIQGTNLILLELPYREYKPWISEEIYNISAEHNLKIVIAHIHRYLRYYSKEQMQHILNENVIFQINNEAFNNFKERIFVRYLIKNNYPFVFGSDCHNITNRKPNWNLLKKKCKIDIIEQSNNTIDKYIY